MVNGFRPDMVVLKLSFPELSILKALSTVGIVMVFQQMPLSVTVAPPLESILPPTIAVLDVMLLALFEFNDGVSIGVLNLYSFPYIVIAPPEVP